MQSKNEEGLPYINHPTHIHGNTLDLFIAKNDCPYLHETSVSDGLSDHVATFGVIDTKLH